MRQVLNDFLEWHANHFGDFAPETNAELLCLANAARAALDPLPATLPEGATFNFEPGDGSITVNLPK